MSDLNERSRFVCEHLVARLEMQLSRARWLRDHLEPAPASDFERETLRGLSEDLVEQAVQGARAAADLRDRVRQSLTVRKANSGVGRSGRKDDTPL
jgi:hypothetical protein